jgi:hypothetical protein
MRRIVGFLVALGLIVAGLYYDLRYFALCPACLRESAASAGIHDHGGLHLALFGLH